MNRREFLEALAVASVAGMPIASRRVLAGNGRDSLYDVPPFGNVSLLHITDCHGQLLPTHYREPSVNLGGSSRRENGLPVVGEHLLRKYGFQRGSRDAYAFTHVDFETAAQRYGKIGGFAQLATLIKRLRADRPNCLLLDGGDSWQGSAMALWTKGQDMIDASKLLGVDMMTAHWEFTLGADRVRQVVQSEFTNGREFLAQNVATRDFGDPVFSPYALREINGFQVGVIGQAYPYTPIANPPHLIPDWTFGIQEEALQRAVDAVRAKGVCAVILLSHNGLDVDLKLASRVGGIDAILGGHTHDPLPKPIVVRNKSGQTLVTNAGSNGKFLGVLDLKVDSKSVRELRYHLLPIFSDMIAPDPEMSRLIVQQRAPYLSRLQTKLVDSDSLLYRRGTFAGSFDQLILDGLRAVLGTELAFSPGFRWGTTLLPREAITWETLLALTGITYPGTEVRHMSGTEIKVFLEDKADNVFNPDPYMQQGGDMTRVGGLTYAINPAKRAGHRISDMRVAGKPVTPGRRYKVATWASLAAGESGRPVWDVFVEYLKGVNSVRISTLTQPRIIGMRGDHGIG